METEMEDLRKYDKVRLKEILKQTNEEMDRVNEECNVLLEILLRKRYKNISETKPFMLRVGKKRYRDNDGSAEHDEELAPPVPIGRRNQDKPSATSASSSSSAAAAGSREAKGTEDGDAAGVEQAEVEADTMVDVDDSKDEAVDVEEQEENNGPEEAGEGDEEEEGVGEDAAAAE